MSETSTTPAGWYPVDGNQERYWDGATWTTDIRPTPAGAGVGTPAPMIEKPKPGANVLGLIALGAAVIGVIFACIPGALIVGWVLLPVAFILGIVGLFLSGKAKWPAIAAIILSVVGTIVAVVVFFAVVFTAADEAFGGTSTVVEEPAAQAPAEDSAAEEPVEAPAAAGVGSRENPAAIGSTITGDEWTVVVNSFTADANQAVADANPFNEPAPAGSHYASVDYTVTYNGEDSGFAAFVGIALVASTGEVMENYDSMAYLTDAMGVDELYAGGTATGSAVFEVPDGADVLIRITPGMIADEVFVAP
jgi:hypothetical protein